MSKQEILIGNARDILKTIPDESVDCIITSPPYYSLRDYGTPGEIWNAKEGCDHEWLDQGVKSVRPYSRGGRESNYAVGTSGDFPLGSICSKCGAYYGQLGLEPTPDMLINNLSSIFKECLRVLKKTGTAFINIGDSYGGTTDKGEHGDPMYSNGRNLLNNIPSAKFRRKCLIQIPARLGLKLYDDGWYIRNRIIWHKPNAMPCSVKDRFTNDYEDVIFCTKSRNYYFNQMLEPVAEVSLKRSKNAFNTKRINTDANSSNPVSLETMGERFVDPAGRNMRTVWSIHTQSFFGEHFAVFPEELVERAIMAGCPKGGVVLDPFCGSGTTLKVCRFLDLDAIGIEVNPEYKKIIEERGLLNLKNIFEMRP